MKKSKHRKIRIFTGPFSEPLYAFLVGAGSVMDVGCAWHGISLPRDSSRADAEALREDWKAVARDIRSASDMLRSE